MAEIIHPPSAHPKTRKLLLGALVLAAVLALISGVLWYFNRSTAGSYTYTYGQLDSYTLNGIKAGRAMNFVKPAGLVQRINSTNIPAGLQASFDQTATRGKLTVLLAELAASTTIGGTPFSPGYLNSLGSSLTAANNPASQAFVLPIKNIVSQRLGSNFSFTFSAPVSLSTSNLKGNAWSLDFTAQTKSGIQKSQPNLQGEVIFAVGKQTFYYFVLALTDYNWQSNQTTIQQIINSIKIDQ